MSNYKGTIKINVIKANDLPNKLVGKRDPKVKMSVQGRKFETRVAAKGDVNPEWNEVFELELLGSEETLNFEVYDFSSVGKDTLLCKADMAISVLVENPNAVAYPLVKGDSLEQAGTLTLSTEFKGEKPAIISDTSGRLVNSISIDQLFPQFLQYLVEVHVIEARNLKNVDFGRDNFSDPYCVVHFDKNTARRTRVIDDNLNPVWDHKLYGLLPPGDQQLLIEVFDKDHTFDSSLGHVTIELGNNFERKEGWFPLLKGQGDIHLAFTKMKASDIVSCRTRLEAALAQIDGLKNAQKGLLLELHQINASSESDKKLLSATIAKLENANANEEKTRSLLKQQVEQITADLASWNLSSSGDEQKQQKQSIQTQLNQINSQVNSSNTEMQTQDILTHLQSLQAQLRAFKQHSETKAKQIEAEATAQVVSVNSRVAMLQRQLEDKSKTEEEKKELQSKLDGLKSSMIALEAEKSKQQQEFLKQIADLQKIRQSADAEAKKKLDEQIKSITAKSSQTITTQDQTIAALTTENDLLKQQLSSLKKSAEMDHKTFSTLGADLENATALIERMRAQRIITSFEKVWSDEGSRAQTTVGIHRPQVPNNYVFFGDLAENGYDKTSFIIALPDDSKTFAAPEGYDIVWASDGTKCSQSVKIWMPRAPKDFVAIGCVATLGNSNTPPNLPKLRCVRKTALATVEADFLWSDENTGAKSQGSFWKIRNMFNTFMAVPSRNKPQGLSLK